MINTFHIWSTVSQPCHDQCSCHKSWSMIIHDQCSEIFSTSGTSWTGTSCFFFFSPVIIASWTICSYMKFYETYPYDQHWSRHGWETVDHVWKVLIIAWKGCWSFMKDYIFISSWKLSWLLGLTKKAQFISIVSQNCLQLLQLSICN